MTAATRVSGPAPLSVVFDPIGVASGVEQPAGGTPNHATFSYVWDFDDPGAGNWAHTGKSKNASNAWIGAHVFETPGDYRVRLTVTDADGAVFEYEEDITVTDPDVVFAARTFYVAAPGSGGSDGNPGTQAQPFATAAAGFAAAFGTSGAARLRFRRGDTFTTPSGLTITGTGPRLIDAYGSGARPRIVFSTTSVGFTVTNGDDVRLVDLDVVSTLDVGSSTGVALGNRTLISRCTLDNFAFAAGGSYMVEAVTYDCEFVNNNDYGVYVFGNNETGAIHLAFLGTRFDVAGQHLFRSYISRSILQGNLFDRDGFSSLKLVGRGPPDPPSRHVCVVDNYIRSESIGPLGIGPEGSTYDEVATHYLVEGNYFYSRQPGNLCVRVMCTDVTVRNNVFDLADNRRAIRVEQWGIGPVPARVVIEHNTTISSGANLYFLDATSSDATVCKNNLFYCPGGTVETPIGTVALSGNVTAAPGMFETLFGVVGGEFALTTSGSNAAVDVGVASLNRLDFAGRPRPVGSGLDVGAFERQEDVDVVVTVLVSTTLSMTTTAAGTVGSVAQVSASVPLTTTALVSVSAPSTGVRNAGLALETQAIGYAGAQDVTPSDTVSLTMEANGIYTSGGDVSVMLTDGSSVQFVALPAGFLPLRIRRVNATGTTAENVTAMF